jgi:hypothetical protein
MTLLCQSRIRNFSKRSLWTYKLKISSYCRRRLAIGSSKLCIIRRSALISKASSREALNFALAKIRKARARMAIVLVSTRVWCTRAAILASLVSAAVVRSGVGIVLSAAVNAAIVAEIVVSEATQGLAAVRAVGGVSVVQMIAQWLVEVSMVANPALKERLLRLVVAFALSEWTANFRQTWRSASHVLVPTNTRRRTAALVLSKSNFIHLILIRPGLQAPASHH